MKKIVIILLLLASCTSKLDKFDVYLYKYKIVDHGFDITLISESNCTDIVKVSILNSYDMQSVKDTTIIVYDTGIYKIKLKPKALPEEYYVQLEYRGQIKTY